MMVTNKTDERLQRRYARFQKKVGEEYQLEEALLKDRPDYFPVYDYFLQMAGQPFTAEALQERTGRRLAGLFCIQAPLELFLAFDLQPVRLCGGYQTAQQVLASNLSVLMCPMLKSFMGNFTLYNNSFQDFQLVVLPTTCDWVVKLPEIMGQSEDKLYYLELPHVKDTEKSQRRWLEETVELKRILEKSTGQKLNRKKLMAATAEITEVWARLDELNKLKGEGILSSVWYMLIANAFLQDKISVWLEKTAEVIQAVCTRRTIEERAKAGSSSNHETDKSVGRTAETALSKETPAQDSATVPAVFMAGSPVTFPNFKLPELVEQAGMHIAADDLCSSERIVPGGVVYSDTSEAGILRALAERYHKACICPTFVDNDRRINNILQVAEKYKIKGVIYNLLKGCHPYDIEAITIEKKLKENGLKFIKIETDYGREDSQNILTRLEAFKQTL